MDLKNDFDIDGFHDNEFLKKSPENIKVLFKYLIARIDIKNLGQEENDVELLGCSDNAIHFEKPGWFKKFDGAGMVLHSLKGSLDLEIKCIQDGQLNIWLRGVDFRDKNDKRAPIFVDFTKLMINEELIFDSRITVSLDHALSYHYIKEKVKDGDTFNIHVEWEPFDSESVYRTK